MITALVLATLAGSVMLNQGIDYYQHQQAVVSQQLATQSHTITQLREDNARLQQHIQHGTITSIDGIAVANLANSPAMMVPIQPHLMHHRIHPYVPYH